MPPVSWPSGCGICSLARVTTRAHRKTWPATDGRPIFASIIRSCPSSTPDRSTASVPSPTWRRPLHRRRAYPAMLDAVKATSPPFASHQPEISEVEERGRPYPSPGVVLPEKEALWSRSPRLKQVTIHRNTVVAACRNAPDVLTAERAEGGPLRPWPLAVEPAGVSPNGNLSNILLFSAAVHLSYAYQRQGGEGASVSCCIRTTFAGARAAIGATVTAPATAWREQWSSAKGLIERRG